MTSRTLRLLASLFAALTLGLAGAGVASATTSSHPASHDYCGYSNSRYNDWCYYGNRDSRDFRDFRDYGRRDFRDFRDYRDFRDANAVIVFVR
ncbi:hypothetical protein OG735_12750 [Streptomyces sp. NBC_01210]|uniref:hypothetical protein n=1 Tax=Streptomyces sp. NBC_01210 TaxID=2903774 RepID=UPI002E1493F2|nr:hypothetical protein OG735_12750 [Streptomyces sp. NBC_01210]